MFTANELLEVAEVVAILTARYREQAERYEKQQAEHRASFEVRTTADAKIIAGLREESAKYNVERDHFYQREGFEQKRRMDAESERDGLLTQVQDMRAEMQRLSAQLDWERAEIKRLQWENVTMHKDAEDGYAAAIKVLGDPVALSKERDALRAEVAALQERLRSSIARGDFAQMEVAALKSQTPKQHPVKVGEWVKASNGAVAQVLEVHKDWYLIARGHGWTFANCEPCDPPNHDTDAGKAAAESALKTEPVADEIKVGDVVEVVSNTGRNTWLADVGSVGTVVTVEEINDSISVHLEHVPGKKNALAGYVSFCDVRKVTT